MTLLTRRATIDLLSRHGLSPRTTIGQHFLVDPNTIRRTVRLAGVAPGDLVVEVGPGLGALTLGLVGAGARVIAIEHDRGMQGPLADALSGTDAVQIIWADAMEVDLHALLAGRPASMVSNLPYQIATPLIVETLRRCPEIGRYLVMVQREVGWRLVAGPGDEGYGAVSVKVAYHGRARTAGPVSRRVFLPEPAVESVLVEIVRRAEPAVAVPEHRLFRLLDAGFGHRRKMLRTALRSAGLPGEAIDGAFAAAGVDGRARAEQLDLETLARLAVELPDIVSR